MIKTIAVVVVLVLTVGAGAVLAYAATSPDTLHVQRATRIAAPPEKIFAFINDFRRWGAWSPYEKIDPAMKRTFSGPASGKGAVYAFEGNSKVGAGRLEITDASAPAKVRLTLDMIKPIAGRNVIEFALEPQGGATNVLWTMHGRKPLIARLLAAFCSIDRMIGEQFEEGLANLKAAAEG